MRTYRHLELLGRGPVSRVRLVNHRPFDAAKIAELATEWNSEADRAECRALVVDCSNVQYLNSDMLSKLIMLQRRLQQKNGRLILSGLCGEARAVLTWTKLDRFFEIKENEAQEVAALA